MARARLAVRCAALAAAVVAAGPVVASTLAAMTMVALSPFVALGSAVAARAVAFTTFIAMPVLAIALVRRRWFCRWLCPTGLLCEQVGRIGLAAGCRAPRVGPVGHWLALVTLGGACLGYPILLWLDPLAILASFLGIPWNAAFTAASLVSGIGLLSVLVLSLVAPGLWCMRICPLGATQELLAALPRLGGRKPGPGGEGGWPVARRAVLAGGLGAVWAWAVRRARDEPPPIRPPGALDEIRFRGVCVRCGTCVRACPTKILHADQGEHGLSGLLTPVVGFDPGYCREDCCRCGEVCPSGAIARLAPAEKKSARMGLAKVDMSVCLLGDERECSICKNVCPYQAIATVWSDEGYTTVLKIDRDRCPGCGACEVACPTEPRKAIVVVA
jgi:ferredoxin-type protein NapF